MQAESDAIEGKEGDHPPAAPFTPFSVTNAEFLAAMFGDVADGAQVAVTSIFGDPADSSWFARDAADIDAVCQPNTNNYFNCSTFYPQPDGKLAAKKEHAADFRTLVLDDVGTKVDWSKLEGVVPTWALETSPGNLQVGFKLETPLTDAAEVARLQDAIDAAGLCDPGAKGMARWVRLPVGINGKPKHRSESGEPFACRLVQWNPSVTYTPQTLLLALDVQPIAEAPGAGRLPHGAANPGASSLVGTNPIGWDIYRPPLAENPVLTRLKEKGLYKREISPGRHDITCPWVDEHTDDLDTGAAYFEPTPEHPVGGFKCQHSHGDRYHVSRLLEHLDVEPSEARNRPTIRKVPGEIGRVHKAVQLVLAGAGTIFDAGGFVAEVTANPATGDRKLQPFTPNSLALRLSELCDFEVPDGQAKDKFRRTDPTFQVMAQVLDAGHYALLPKLAGFARNPFYRTVDGHLVTTSGFDAVSQRFGLFDGAKFSLPEPTLEAARAAIELLLGLLAEFRFKREADKAATLSAIFTASLRAGLGHAPAFHVSAPTSGTGKSFLCRLISLFATPGRPVRMSYPRTAEEATKAILSALITSPAVIEFDDMATDWIPHGIINSMLTSDTVSERVLGVSKMATVSTEVLVLASGNNVGPTGDLERRVITIRLDAQTQSPATRHFSQDPVEMVRADREKYLAAVFTIVEAWKAAGSPKADVKPIASFNGRWADMCRHALIWMGLPDPATSLLEQVSADPEAEVLGPFLRAWYDRYGDRPMTLRAALNGLEPDGDLAIALEDLPVFDGKEINRSKLGWYLKKHCDRIVGDLVLRPGKSAERTAWRVCRLAPEPAEEGAPPSPPLPPSVPSEPAEGGSSDPGQQPDL